MTKLLDKAIHWAVTWHEGQYRKSIGIPYVSHTFDVMKKLTRYGVTDEEWLSAALLHDAVEDTDVTLAQLTKLFSKRVGDIVDYVTWPTNDLTKQQKWNLLVAKSGSDSSVKLEGTLLKLADRISNVEDYRTVSSSRRYASKYALEGFPVFFTFLTQYREPSNEKVQTVLQDLSKMETIIQEKYPNFKMEETSLDEAQAMLFGPKA